MKNKRGITLVSLIITIILLIILAGVAISLAMSENGLIAKSKFAKESYINSEKEEQKQINDLYSQLLIATNDDATVSMKVKELKQLIDETVDSKLYMNTTKKIANISSTEEEYEATEDCIITGYIGGYGNSAINILINGVLTGYTGNTTNSWVYVPVYYHLKAGQKILFKKISGTKTQVTVSVFSTL